MSTVFVLQGQLSIKDMVLDKHMPEVFSTLESAMKYVAETYPNVTEREGYYTNVTYYGIHLDDNQIFTEVCIYERKVR